MFILEILTFRAFPFPFPFNVCLILNPVVWKSTFVLPLCKGPGILGLLPFKSI
uniref:Uncharacterized protein n=1 Tax=Anguilla anguilla TaxID=7936 RepID=A0A0E9PJX0_ANGAN